MLRLTDISKAHNITVDGIIDHDYYENTDHIQGIPIIGSEKTFFNKNLDQLKNDYNFFIATNWHPTRDDIAIRNREKRKYLINVVKELNLPCINLIHPSAVVSEMCVLGQGIFIGALSMIDNDVILKDFSAVKEQARVCHGSSIGENSIVQSFCYVGSDSQIHDNVYCGIHSIILPNHTIQSHAMLHPNFILNQSVAPYQIIPCLEKRLNIF
jgi:acyl-[acyl carrier protein]--UDP-N-acetylglucosamine O-acyltransferase